MKNKSIRKILLQALMILTIVTLGLSFSIFVTMQYRTLKMRATTDMQASCNSIAVSLEQDIKELDTILLYSIASAELKQEFSDYMNSENSFEKNRNRQKLAGTMISLKGFDFAIRQLNMYDYNEGGYGVGNYNGDLNANAADEMWYESVKNLAGRKYICAPVTNIRASRFAQIADDTAYFSVCRMVYGNMHIPLGFIEVEEYYDDIFERIGYVNGSNDPVIVIYDAYGRQIFPLEEQYDYYSHKDSRNSEIKNEITGKKQYLCFSVDERDGIVVAMALDSALFMEPVYKSLLPMVFTLIVIFLICVMIAATLSRRLSNPLRRMYDFLSDVNKESFERLKMDDSGIREIDKLRDTINENITTQENNTRTMLTLKEQEMQARMLALQAQMNPHFLYNSLTFIGEMANIGETEQVANMCEDITSILRYISSDSKQRIRVEEEMEQVDTYLRCIKRRFGDGLVCSYNIDDDILDCMVPKLCVQILVENAVKAVMEHRSPWMITIDGGKNGDDWYITVSDNGPGFDPKTDKELRNNMDRILETGVLPSLKIEGMGILNIFIRLYLLDGIPFVFDFGNREEGGAFVTVGGHIHAEDRSL